jgi:hypothetical protein
VCIKYNTFFSQAAQHVFVKYKATYFGYKGIAILRPRTTEYKKRGFLQL